MEQARSVPADLEMKDWQRKDATWECCVPEVIAEHSSA